MMNELTAASFPGALSGAERETLPDFAALVHQHQSMVYSLARSFLRDEATAEEVAQDVFLELHTALPALESAQHVQRWLRRVTAHRSIDCIRRRRPTLALMDVHEPAVPAGVGDVLLHDKLRKLVATLPPAARMMVVLRYQEGLALEEIAESMDLTVRSVKGRLHRAIVLLREKLERQTQPRNSAGEFDREQGTGSYDA